MVRRRSQLIPWRVAGGVADEHANADQVVRETGWVFNNETGAALTLEDFVMSGNKEVNAYLRVFGMNEMNLEELSVLEIGSGIGRMTSRLTHRFGTVIAADVDATFLERCRETVAKHGVINRLRTAHVTDGHTVPLADNSVDAVFSYITLQHCSNADALSLTKESLRVAKPYGVVMLNYRTWVLADIFCNQPGHLFVHYGKQKCLVHGLPSSAWQPAWAGRQIGCPPAMYSMSFGSRAARAVKLCSFITHVAAGRCWQVLQTASLGAQAFKSACCHGPIRAIGG